jgi:dTDP-4-dehydrorhamnose reductase
MTNSIKILVLGATGMLGNAVLQLFAQSPGYSVVGSVRSLNGSLTLPAEFRELLINGVDAENLDSLTQLIANVRPEVVINCIGLVKQSTLVYDPLVALPINALLPHRLAHLCGIAGARLIHISTDCVFSGSKGNYNEHDTCDANDLYGRSKFLGEVDYPHAITLRTSIIGHELHGSRGLLGWFLAQQGSVKGFTGAIFSGLPTVELSCIIRDVILPRRDLRGLYHVAAQPISKYELLRLVAEIYGKAIEILPDGQLTIDRSLDAGRFKLATGYEAPAWPELIGRMYEFTQAISS